MWRLGQVLCLDLWPSLRARRCVLAEALTSNAIAVPSLLYHVSGI